MKARELSKELGYKRWSNFNGIINRARHLIFNGLEWKNRGMQK